MSQCGKDLEDTVLGKRSRHTSTQPVTPLTGNVPNRIKGQEVDLSEAGEGMDDCL
jgi:hypothetical protein